MTLIPRRTQLALLDLLQTNKAFIGQPQVFEQSQLDRTAQIGTGSVWQSGCAQGIAFRGRSQRSSRKSSLKLHKSRHRFPSRVQPRKSLHACRFKARLAFHSGYRAQLSFKINPNAERQLTPAANSRSQRRRQDPSATESSTPRLELLRARGGRSRRYPTAASPRRVPRESSAPKHRTAHRTRTQFHTSGPPRAGKAPLGTSLPPVSSAGAERSYSEAVPPKPLLTGGAARSRSAAECARPLRAQ